MTDSREPKDRSELDDRNAVHPEETEHDPEDVPEAVRKESRDPENPADIGGPQAEPKGVWRVLRNSALLAILALALVYAWMAL
jgi:hypothetical protein